MNSTEEMLEHKKWLESLPVPSDEDIAELKRLGGIRVDGSTVKNEDPDHVIAAVYTYGGSVYDYRGHYGYNNSVTAAYLSDGQVWVFFRSDSNEIENARHRLLHGLCPIHSAHVPFSVNGHHQLVEMLVESGYIDGSIKKYIDDAALDHLREQAAKNELALYH